MAAKRCGFARKILLRCESSKTGVALCGFVLLAPLVVNGAQHCQWQSDHLVVGAIGGLIDFLDSQESHFAFREITLDHINVGETAKTVRNGSAVFPEQ